MPCYTPPHSYCNHGIDPINEAICEFEGKFEKVRNAFQEIIKNYNQELNERVKYYKEKSDESVRLLCKVMQEITSQSLGVILDQEVKDWYEKHKEFDEKRK